MMFSESNYRGITQLMTGCSRNIRVNFVLFIIREIKYLKRNRTQIK